MGRSKLNIILGVDVTALVKGLGEAESKLGKFARGLKSTGKALTTSLTLPIAIAGTAAVKTFADFELSIAKVAAVSGAAGKALQTLKADALELGRTTQFTASEVAGLQLNLSKLGFSPEEIGQSTAAILDLALATGEDLAQSATVAASTLRGFGLDATETIRVTNVMADSFSSTALDLEKFGTAMAYVAPVATQAGASIEQTSAILGTLVNRGVDASSAGAALRNIFLDISAEGLTLTEAMDKVKNSTNPLTTAMELFGKRGATVATIMANNRDEITRLTADFRDSEGEAAKMADIMENTTAGSFKKLQSAVEGAGISMGEVLAPTINKVATFLTELVAKFTALNPETKKTIVIVAALAAGIGPLLLAIGSFVQVASFAAGGLKVLTIAMSKFSAATLISPPILALAATVAILYGAFTILKNKLDLATASQRAASDINQTAASQVEQETGKIKVLIGLIENETTSREAKIEAVKELKKLQPEYFGQLDDEGTKIDILRQGYDRLRTSILLRSKATAASAKNDEIAERELDLQLKLQKARERQESNSFLDKAARSITGDTGVALQKINEELQALQKEKDTVADIFSNATEKLLEFEAASGSKKIITVPTITPSLDDIGGGAVIGEVGKKIVVPVEFDFEIPDTQIFEDFVGGDLFRVDELEAQAGRVSEVMKQYQDGLVLATDSAKVFGAEAGDILKAKLDFTSQALTNAIETYGPYSEQVALLRTQYMLLNQEVGASAAKFNEQQQAMKFVADTVGNVVTSAFTSFFEVLDKGGTNAFAAFAKGLKNALVDVIKQLAIALAKAIAIAVIFSIILPGSSAAFTGGAGSLGTKIGNLFKQFSGIGLAQGGIIPPGYPNDTFPARLSSGEAVIPLDKLNQYGSFNGQLEARISGDDLLILLNQAKSRANRYA